MTPMPHEADDVIPNLYADRNAVDWYTSRPAMTKDANIPMLKTDPGRQGLALQYAPFILVVDDDQFIGELLAELLIDAGYRVQVAHDGNEAFEIAQHDIPALVLSDIMMPTCDGAKLARRIHETPQTRDVPVALMSSARPKLAGLEGIPFLPKPFDIDDVITFVNRHVRMIQYPHGEG